MEPAVEINHLSKRFQQPWPLFAPWKRTLPVQALQEVSLSIPPGTLFALVGPNGSGKTTLLKILAGLILPDKGTVRVQGRISLIRSGGLSFYRRLTARQNLEFFATLYNLSRREAQDKIISLARQFQLDEILDRPYEKLSTGSQQRLALARSLLKEASILLADEPTRSLDPLSKREFRELLKRLCKERGKAALLTTHDLQEAREMADTLGILHRGRLRWVGPPPANLEELFEEECRAS